MTTSRERIGELLGSQVDPESFVARRMASPDDLDLRVEGAGRIPFPVTDEVAEALCEIAEPARYGLGEETLLDREVRDTWEIPKERVKIAAESWDRTLEPVLLSLRADLALPEESRLEAVLHSMLVYAPGQFFAPHQDSEKEDAMVATLVVTLPSSFQGGAFVVEHGGRKVTSRGSGKQLSFVAFYADCRHEVRPVTKGFRIVLTYNLLLRGGDTVLADDELVEALADELQIYFDSPRPPHWSRRDAPPREPPNRLVYLLDHAYTEHGLDWGNLKGCDARRAVALRAAAERCGCEVALALAEIEETWQCMEPGWDDHWSRRHRRWARDDDGGWEEDEPPLDGPDAGDAPSWVALADDHGEEWLRDLVGEWKIARHRIRTGDRIDLDTWLATFPRFCEALFATDEAVGVDAARALWTATWPVMEEALCSVATFRRPRERDRRLAELAPPFLGLLESAALLGQWDLRDRILRRLSSSEHGSLLPVVMPMLRAGAEAHDAEAGEALGLDLLESEAREELETLLAEPPREADDWSISPPKGCECDLCRTLARFLAASEETRFEWPIAKDKRKHVHRRIDAHALPVRHETRRSGRPYTLVLEKSRELFTSEEEKRRGWQADLHWLQLEE